MNEAHTLDIVSPTDAESNKLNFAELARSWVNREARRQLDHSRTHPPLLSGDQFSIDGQGWTVSLVNDALLQSEWHGNETPKIPFLSDFSMGYTPSRAVAVVYPGEGKKQTYYLVFGRRSAGKKKYEPSFQLIPVDDETRVALVERPEADLLTKFFVRSREPTKLEEDTTWSPELPVRPVTDIAITHKNHIPETEVPAFTTLKVAVAERDRMYIAWRKAWKFFPGAALLGGMTTAILSGATLGGSGVMPSVSGLISGSAVGLSTVIFQKTLEELNRDLNNVISEQQSRPGIRRLATLKFSDQRNKS